MEEREVKGHIDHNSDERRRGYDRLDYLFRTQTDRPSPILSYTCVLMNRSSQGQSIRHSSQQQERRRPRVAVRTNRNAHG
jgi:hypothetical protein